MLDVVNSRKSPERIKVWRRRRCKDCGFIFTTQEAIDSSKLLRLQASIRKKQLTPYSRGSLLRDLYRAFEHKNEPDAPLALLETIEENLLMRAAKQEFTITQAKLHEIVIEVLERYDKVAALTYAVRHNLAI